MQPHHLRIANQNQNQSHILKRILTYPCQFLSKRRLPTMFLRLCLDTTKRRTKPDGLRSKS